MNLRAKCLLAPSEVRCRRGGPRTPLNGAGEINISSNSITFKYLQLCDSLKCLQQRYTRETLCTRLIEQENNFHHERVFNNLTVTVKILMQNKWKAPKNLNLIAKCCLGVAAQMMKFNERHTRARGGARVVESVCEENTHAVVSYSWSLLGWRLWTLLRLCTKHAITRLPHTITGKTVDGRDEALAAVILLQLNERKVILDWWRAGWITANVTAELLRNGEMLTFCTLFVKDGISAAKKHLKRKFLDLTLEK